MRRVQTLTLSPTLNLSFPMMNGVNWSLNHCVHARCPRHGQGSCVPQCAGWHGKPRYRHRYEARFHARSSRACPDDRALNSAIASHRGHARCMPNPPCRPVTATHQCRAAQQCRTGTARQASRPLTQHTLTVSKPIDAHAGYRSCATVAATPRGKGCVCFRLSCVHCLAQHGAGT